jgi:talin
LLNNVPGTRGANADDVVKAAREVLQVTSDMAFASTQADTMQAGKAAYSAIDHLVNSSKGASALSQDPAVQKGVTVAAGGTARSVVDLIEVGKLNRNDPQTQPRIEQASEKVAASVNALVQALRKLPNSEHVTLQDAGIDLDAKAEQELIKCAKIIEEAAKTLLAAKPPPREKKTPGVIDKMDINEAILDAATAIARATGSLVQSAAIAQRERADQKRNQPAGSRYQNDPTWANGLISAAQQVSGSVQSLVVAANSSAQGNVEEEALVASARSVAAATAHLVAAAKAKADPNSQAQRNLSNAAKAVANATSQLVSAANKAGQFQDEEEEDDSVALANFSTAAGKKQELEQQMRILRLEKELEKERVRMTGLRKAKYADAKKGI